MVELAFIGKIVELFDHYNLKVSHIDCSKPFETCCSQVRGMVLDVIDEVFLVVPTVIKQDKDIQSVLFNLISRKLNEYLENCLALIFTKFERPNAFPTESTYSEIYNFLTILISKSKQFIKTPDPDALLDLGIYAALVNNDDLI